VLEAPYTSVADRAQEVYWFLPARWLVRDRFDNLSRIDRIDAPAGLFDLAAQPGREFGQLLGGRL